MTEVNVTPKIDPAIDTAFEKLKLLDAANQEIGCKHIGEKYGRDVEAKLRAMLAAIVAPAPLAQSQPAQRIFRRDLKSPAAAVEQPKPEPKLEPLPAQQSLTVVAPTPERLAPDAIVDMNNKHAVISSLGGKCVVMEWAPYH